MENETNQNELEEGDLITPFNEENPDEGDGETPVDEEEEPVVEPEPDPEPEIPEPEPEPEPVITEEEESKTEVVPFEVVRQENNTVEKGIENVLQEGQNGIRTITELVTYVDGIETNREQISSEITTQPINRIVEYGTREEEPEDNTKNRRNKKMKYGLKEVADVIFFDIQTDRPVLVFDTLKVSNIENASESAEATGGKGNSPLVSWDYGRTATLTMQDALLSDQSLAMLAGTEVTTGADVPNITRYEVVVVGEGGAFTPSHDVAGEVTAYDNSTGVLGETLDVTGEAGEMKVAEATAGDRVALFYESVADEDSTLVTFQSDKFPSIYRVVGTSLVRDTDGIDHPFQFRIPRAKLQSGFTFTMDPENVSTFDFNLQVLVDQGTKQLYDIIRM